MEAFRSPEIAIDDTLDLGAFEAGLRGSIVLPGSVEYDEARQVKSAQYDRRPALIVRAADAGDVARTVDLARESGLQLSVRGGAHSLAGFGTNDGGIVLDLGAMKGLHIDPVGRTAWAQPGLTAGEYTMAAAAHGLATPFGDTASVGIGGLTLGGGIGWLVRRYGMTIDSLLAVEVVTADGRQITANPDSHPDLFWAVRGGGGNFGVVTRFQFRLHPVGEILGGALFLPAMPEVLRNLVPIAQAAPEELTTISFLMRIPPMPFVPAEQVGKLSVVLMFVWCGDPDAGQAALEPFRQVATPLAEAVMPMPYPGIYQLLAEAEKRAHAVHRSRFLDTVDDDAVEAILGAMAAPSSPATMIQIRVLGGAMSRVPADATAFAHRDAAVMLLIITGYEDPSTAPMHVAWTVGLWEMLAAHDTGVYSNFLESEGVARIRAAYPG
ncbi:MAG TPA: FAD-binding oxidoreductase, partial [Candidatus Limnocylindrales bacterium]|nr:FAD-binding oxidoreductase [Candidatus Limnocylindrales bacterium]